MLPPCLSCAACCFSTLETYVRVDGDDYARIGDEAASLTQFVGNRCFMRMSDGHCAALQMSTDSPRACAIYERRPEVCRALERGSPACEAELLQKQQRPEILQLTLRKGSEA